jgi:hypothetical protein
MLQPEIVDIGLPVDQGIPEIALNGFGEIFDDPGIIEFIFTGNGSLEQGIQVGAA